MFAAGHDFLIAVRRARQAARRGDAAESARWLKIAEAHVRLATQLHALTKAEEEDARILDRMRRLRGA